MAAGRIAVFGAGAVGCYFGGMLARVGAPVSFVGRPRFVEAVAANGLDLETRTFREAVRVRASSDPSTVREADTVLLCVKTLDTEKAARELAPHLAKGALLVCMQNGVDNAERVRAATGIEAVSAVVYVGAAMVGPGHVKHSGAGHLVLARGAQGAAAERLSAIFEGAAVPCKVLDSVEPELWTKLVLNCAYNAISALTKKTYGRMSEEPLIRDAMHAVVAEAQAVAAAAGVQLEDPRLPETIVNFGSVMPGATSSTSQDIERGNRTEIDSLNGYLVRRGAELGVAVPVNQALYALVKLLESP